MYGRYLIDNVGNKFWFIPHKNQPTGKKREFMFEKSCATRIQEEHDDLHAELKLVISLMEFHSSFIFNFAKD